MSHFVYRLIDIERDTVIYIGRSIAPERRRWAFQHNYGIAVRLGQMERYTDFDQACAAELRAIARMRPFFNKKMISSRGRVGASNTPEHNAKVSAKLKGRTSPLIGIARSEETKAKISASNKGRVGTMKGRKFTTEHRAKISAALTGKPNGRKGIPHSPEHSAAISRALLAKKERT